jgi:hypothetical protein
MRVVEQLGECEVCCLRGWAVDAATGPRDCSCLSRPGTFLVCKLDSEQNCTALMYAQLASCPSISQYINRTMYSRPLDLSNLGSFKRCFSTSSSAVMILSSSAFDLDSPICFIRLSNSFSHLGAFPLFKAIANAMAAGRPPNKLSQALHATRARYLSCARHAHAASVKQVLATMRTPQPKCISVATCTLQLTQRVMPCEAFKPLLP